MSCCYPYAFPQTSGGVVYLLDASFGFCPLNLACNSGPRMAQFFGGMLADVNCALVSDGFPGWTFAEERAALDNQLEFRVTSTTTNEIIPVAVLGFSGDALLDTTQSGIPIAAGLATDMFQFASTVIALDYPPMYNRDLPFLTEGAGVDQVWWDTIYRPAYRAALAATGAIVLPVYQDWQATGIVRPPQAPFPDYHVDSPSSRRAAQRLFNFVRTLL